MKKASPSHLFFPFLKRSLVLVLLLAPVLNSPGQKERSKEKDCPEEVIHGDPSHTDHVEFKLLDRTVRVHFSELLVRRTEEGRHGNNTGLKIIFPRFGAAPDYYRYEEAAGEEPDAELMRKLSETLWKLEIKVKSPRRVGISDLTPGLGSCLHSEKKEGDAMTEQEREMQQRMSQGRKAHSNSRPEVRLEDLDDEGMLIVDTMQVRENEEEISIDLKASFPGDSSVGLELHVSSSPYLPALKEEAGKEATEEEKALKKEYQERYGDTVDVELVSMTRYPASNEYEYVRGLRGLGRDPRTGVIPGPKDEGDPGVDRGKELSYSGLYHYERNGPDETVVLRHDLYFGDGERRDEEGKELIFRTPFMGLAPDEGHSDLIEGRSPDEVLIRKGELRELNFSPVIFDKEKFEGELRGRVAPENPMFGFRSIPEGVEQEVQAPPERDLYCRVEGMSNYQKSLEQGDEGYRMKMMRGDEVLPEIELYERERERELSEEQLNALTRYDEGMSEKQQKVRKGELSEEEVLEWAQGIAEELGLEVDGGKGELRTFEMGFKMAFKERYGKEALEYGPLVGKEEEIEEIRTLCAAMIRKRNELTQKMEPEDKEAFLEALKEELRPIFAEHDIEIPDIERMRELGRSLKERIGEHYDPGLMRKVTGRHFAGSLLKNEELKIDEEGHSVERSYEQYGNRRPGLKQAYQLEFGADSLLMSARIKGQGKERYGVRTPTRPLDALQFEHAVSSLPLEEDYSTELYFGGVKKVKSMSGGTGRRGSSGTHLQPTMLKADLEVKGKERIERFGEEIPVYEVKALLEGEVSSLSFLSEYADLFRDPESGSGYITLYLREEAPQHLLRVEARRGKAEFYTR